MWRVKCTCDLCVVWVCIFRKYLHVLLRVRTFRKDTYVLQHKVRIPVSSTLVTWHIFSLILCSVLVKEFSGISKNDITSGVFVHYLVERRAYSCWDMMSPECSFVWWSSFLMRLVPAMSWARRCQRLQKLGLPWILWIGPMAVLIFSALYFTTFRLLHRNRVIRPLWSLCVTAIYRSGVFWHFTSIAPPRFIGPILSYVLLFCTGTMWFYRYGNFL